jgi:hypothetical protein
MNISAVDIGFKNVKGIINGKKVFMKSVVGDSRTLKFEDLNIGKKDTDHLKSKVGSKEYFVSDLAIEQSDTVYYSLNDDRFNSESTDVLVKTAFALGFGNESTQTSVVSGLPASHYKTYKDDIKDLFLKTHRYAVMNDKTLLKGSTKITQMVSSYLNHLVPYLTEYWMTLVQIADNNSWLKDRSGNRYRVWHIRYICCK